MTAPLQQQLEIRGQDVSPCLAFVLSDDSCHALQFVVDLRQMIGLDLGHHSPTPMYDGQRPVTDGCKYTAGAPCYYDGSSLAAEDMLATLLREGSDGVWREMRECYNSVFGEVVK